MRGDETDARLGARVARGHVLERRLDERAVLTVQLAVAWGDVRVNQSTGM